MRTLIITGSASGIGYGIAKRFLSLGDELVLIDKDAEKLEKAIMDLGKPSHLHSYVCDLEKLDELNGLLDKLSSKHRIIHAMINNVGVGAGQDFLDLSLEAFERVMAVNLRSTFLFSQYAAKTMIRNKIPGRIINIASTRALMSEPGTEAYSASKGAILSLTHAMAASLAPYHITVNAISPGWIHCGDEGSLSKEDHQQHWSGRVGRPEDIAKACQYLADPDNQFITGQNLVIDGGMTRKMIYIE